MIETALVLILFSNGVQAALNNVSAEDTTGKGTAKEGDIRRDGLSVFFPLPIIEHILIQGWRG